MDETARLPCPHCTFSASSVMELESHKAQIHPVPALMKACTIPGCTCSFSLTRELNDHLVTTHRYFRCLDSKCKKVFKQKSRMETHFTKHGSIIPTRPPPNQEQQGTTPPHRKHPSAEKVSELAEDTYRYLQSVQDLADGSKTRSEACLKMINEVFEGIASDQRQNFATSLYLRAIQVAMTLPPAPVPNPLPSFDPHEPLNSSLVLSNSIDSGVSTRPDMKPTRRNSILSDDPQDSDFSGGDQHREKQNGGDVLHPPIRRILKRKREATPNGSDLPPNPAEPTKRKKSHLCSDCGRVFWKKRDLGKHRGDAHGVKKAVETQGLVLRIQTPEVCKVDPPPPPCPVSSFICIEEPCSEVFPSFHELWAHLTSAHYSNNHCP